MTSEELERRLNNAYGRPYGEEHEVASDAIAALRAAEQRIAGLEARLEAAERDARLDSLQTMVRFILETAGMYEWSLQGMGMLRLYMGNTRLHIWDRSFAVPGVSMIHDHLQWGLRSTIIAGTLINQRYAISDFDEVRLGAAIYNFVTLKAGFGCKFVESPKRAWLRPLAPEIYGPGDTYEQKPDEIHETIVDGVCITMMKKSPTGTDTARVFWPEGEEWGSAEPRKATPDEVRIITTKAAKVLDAAIDALSGEPLNSGDGSYKP